MVVSLSFPTLFVWVIRLFLIVSLFASWPQMMGLWLGIPDGLLTLNGEFGARIFRELILLLLIILMMLSAKKVMSSCKSLLFVLGFIVLPYIVIEFALALVAYALPVFVPLAGVRVFEYIPVLISVVYLVKIRNITMVNEGVAKSVIAFIIVQGVIGIAEVLFAAPTTGQTILGARAFGTFSNPNIYGIVMSGCALILYLMDTQKYKKWVVIVFMLSVLSGSRAGFLSAFIVLFIQFLPASRGAGHLFKGVFFMAFPLVVSILYVFMSSSEMSGRVIHGEERLSVWSLILNTISSPIQILFGTGMGLGSNTVTTVFGAEAFKGQFISDNLFIFILTSYGLIGITLVLFLIMYMLSLHMSHKGIAFMLYFILVSSANISFEIFPLNVILMYMLGLLLAKPNTGIACKYHKNQSVNL